MMLSGSAHRRENAIMDGQNVTIPPGVGGGQWDVVLWLCPCAGDGQQQGETSFIYWGLLVLVSYFLLGTSYVGSYWLLLWMPLP